MIDTRLKVFLGALGYPVGECQEKEGLCTLHVDDVTCTVRVAGECYRLVCTLGGGIAPDVGLLAGYANGRLLAEDAALAWDPAAAAPILWQNIPLVAEPAQIRESFETYLASCEWWRARLSEMQGAPQSLPEMLIIP